MYSVYGGNYVAYPAHWLFTDDCRLPSEEGQCRGNLQRWHFDSSTGRCRTFTYGGCQGNRNNFGSEAECMNSCRSEVVVRPVTPAPTVAPPTRGRPRCHSHLLLTFISVSQYLQNMILRSAWWSSLSQFLRWTDFWKGKHDTKTSTNKINVVLQAAILMIFSVGGCYCIQYFIKLWT